jgi:hypothetical protein
MVVTTIIIFALLLCALAISSSITRLYLQNIRKNDPSYDEFEDEEAREAGLPPIISRRAAQKGLTVFSATFFICIVGIVCIVLAYYGLSIRTALVMLTMLFSIKRCIVIAVFVLISYAIATTYFQKSGATKPTRIIKDKEENSTNIWSLFKIKFGDILQKKNVLYLDDAMAFYRTLGYFWIGLLVLLVIV